MRLSRIYASIIKPHRILFVATGLLYLEIFASVTLTIVSGEPIVTVGCLVFSHLFCIHLTNKEPHINNILRNFYLQIREYVGIKSDEQPHFRTKTFFNETGVLYEL